MSWNDLTCQKDGEPKTSWSDSTALQTGEPKPTQANEQEAAHPQDNQLPGVPVKDNPSVTGDLRLIPDFKSDILHDQRTLRVWLPPGYNKNPHARYPVLYMEDGQTLFDKALSPFSHEEWRADETAEALINSHLIPPLIIVGIDNLDRINEYMPTYDSDLKAGGKADLYTQFFIKEVKPYIDREFRTKPDRANTALGGSSLGAVISLYMAVTQPQLASKLILCSTADWPDHHALLKWLKPSDLRLPDKIWLDVGTGEGGTQVQDAQTLATIFKDRGLRLGKTLAYVVDANAPHSETAWQRRFGMALMFLYGSH